MQSIGTAQNTVPKRRSLRLANNSNVEIPEPPQAPPLSKHLSNSLHQSHPPTIANQHIVVLNEEMDLQISTTDLQIPNPLYHGYVHSEDKENMFPLTPQLYDRIKQNPRKATKKSLSNTSQKSQPVEKQSTSQQKTADMSISATELPWLQVPGHATAAAAPPSAGSNSVDQGAVDRTRPEMQHLPEAVSMNRALPPKRLADPACNSTRPVKRSRLLPSQSGQEVRSSIEEPSRLFTGEVALQDQTEAATTGAPQLGKGDIVDSTKATDSFIRSTTPDTTRKTTPALSESSDRADQDLDFIHKMRKTLKQHSERKTANVGRRQARRILEILRRGKPPGNTDALFASGEEAKAHLRANQYFPGPIITEGQQPLELQTIEDFLAEQCDDDVKVWIQDPSRPDDRGPSTREITIGKLKEQFHKYTPYPYNCLELAAHVEDGLRPSFLNTEDCRLLTKLKHPSSGDQASRRRYEPGWKEVEKWALLAKAGALTEPHQDSHGYSTYITVNQGVIGFGWLSNPTDEQRAAWRKDPATFINGEWRYVVLRPGQTVYFPAGTVHFVFRHPSEGDTLAFGGHVLRSSQIGRWVKTLLEEKETHSQVTNEDLCESAPGYLARVEKFVRQAKRTGQMDKWGGKEAIEEFLRLKAEFLGEEGMKDGLGI